MKQISQKFGGKCLQVLSGLFFNILLKCLIVNFLVLLSFRDRNSFFSYEIQYMGIGGIVSYFSLDYLYFLNGSEIFFG